MEDKKAFSSTTNQAENRNLGKKAAKLPGSSTGIPAGSNPDCGLDFRCMLEALKPHEHICLIYESPREWRHTVIPYLAIGLARSEKCVYFYHHSRPAEILEHLKKEGVDVDQVVSSGALELLNAPEAYAANGSIDPDTLIGMLIKITQQAIAKGYPALRLTGEMTTIHDNETDVPKLLEYKARLNSELYEKYPCIGLCQYDRARTKPETLRTAMLTHPLVIHQERIYHNFYYIPTKQILGSTRTKIEVDNWLINLNREEKVRNALLENLERHLILSGMTSDYVYSFKVNPDGTMIKEWVVGNFKRITGFTPEELEKRGGWSKLIHPEDLPVAIKRSKRLLHNQADTSEFRIITKDGSVRWLRDHGHPVWDGQQKRVVRILGSAEDITERKNSEAGIRKSEEAFRQLFENSLSAIAVHELIVDEAGKPVDYIFLNANRAFQQHTGLRLKNIKGRRVTEVLPGIEKTGFIPKYGQVVQTGRPVSFEQYSEPLNKYYLIAAYKVADMQFATAFIDITARTLAELDLKMQSSLINTMLENLPIGLAISTISTGTAIYINQYFEHIYDISRHDISNIDLFWEKAYKDPVYREMIRNRVTEDIKSGDPSRMVWDNIELTSSTGEKRVILAMTIPIPDQDLMISTVQDVTHRSRSEQALRRAAEEWRATFDSITDMIAIIDSERKILRVNKAFAQAFNQTPRELVGKHCYQVVHCSASVHPACTLFETLSESQPTTHEIYEPVLDKYLECSMSPFVDDNGRITGVVHIFKDITQRRQMEAEQQALRERAEITSRLASVGEMAAGIAHEINNPLTGVIGFSELLLQEDLPLETKAQLKIIAEGSNRVKEIVKRMLVFARQTKPQKTILSIHYLIENTLQLRSYVLSTANIEVVKAFDPDLPSIMADPGQMQQVIMNLVVNAEFAMKKAHDGGRLTITTTSKGDLVEIIIEDNGTGMDAAIRARLFQPFYTTKDPGEGTGLGLSVSRSIILEHGGDITVESTPGKGTRVIIQLPAAMAVQGNSGQNAPQADREMPAGKARILVVDDEPSVRALILKVLQSEGHLAEEAENADMALEKLITRQFDAAFIDMRMPGRSGKELYTELNTVQPQNKTRIVFITGDASDITTRRFLAESRLPFIAKPFDRDELLEKLRQVLSGNQPV